MLLFRHITKKTQVSNSNLEMWDLSHNLWDFSHNLWDCGIGAWESHEEKDFAVHYGKNQTNADREEGNEKRSGKNRTRSSIFSLHIEKHIPPWWRVKTTTSMITLKAILAY